MDLKLSWDLFIIVFFGLILAYSFIIGRNNSFKIIIVSYVAALVADAAGILIGRLLSLSGNFMKLLSMFSIQTNEQAIVLSKAIVFVTLIVLLSVRGSFDVYLDTKGSASVRLLINFITGFLNACLIISIILIFIAGNSLLLGEGVGLGSAYSAIYGQSNLARLLVDNYSIWFLLPAFAFFFLSLGNSKSEN